MTFVTRKLAASWGRVIEEQRSQASLFPFTFRDGFSKYTSKWCWNKFWETSISARDKLPCLSSSGHSIGSPYIGSSQGRAIEYEIFKTYLNILDIAIECFMWINTCFKSIICNTFYMYFYQHTSSAMLVYKSHFVTLMKGQNEISYFAAFKRKI